MNKLFTTLSALLVASATGLAFAQATPASAPAPAAAASAPAPAAAASAPAPAAAAKPAAQPNTPASLQAKIAMCLGCHNIQGYQASFPEVHRVPRIAGQNAAYIEAALNAYKGGERKHPTMRGIADQLSEQDIKDIAGYYAKLGGEPAAAPAKASREPSPQVAALLQKAACVSCHGANFTTATAPNYPKLAGQYKDYLFVALKSYKVEGGANLGRNNGIMGPIAKQFSNAELKALADYLGSLEGDLKTVPESRFHGKSH